MESGRPLQGVATAADVASSVAGVALTLGKAAPGGVGAAIAVGGMLLDIGATFADKIAGGGDEHAHHDGKAHPKHETAHHDEGEGRQQ